MKYLKRYLRHILKRQLQFKLRMFQYTHRFTQAENKIELN